MELRDAEGIKQLLINRLLDKHEVYRITRQK